MSKHTYDCEGEDCPLCYLDDEIERLTAELGHAKAFGKATDASLQLARKDYETQSAENLLLHDRLQQVTVEKFRLQNAAEAVNEGG